MNTTTGDKDSKTLRISTTYKHPIFDGEDTNKFKDCWWDNNGKVMMEIMEDLEEYVGKGKKITQTPCTTLPSLV